MALNTDVETPLALVVESIGTVDRGALVVTAEHEKVFWVLAFVGEEGADDLRAVQAHGPHSLPETSD